jgi:hypothetical protein
MPKHFKKLDIPEWTKIELDHTRIVAVVVRAAREHPEIVEAILNAVRHEVPHRRVNCPYPAECNQFPCESLCCDADCCSNGHTYRWS